VIGSGELEGKVVAITASVPAADRGRKGLAALAQTLGAMRARIVGGEPIVRGDGAGQAMRVLLAALADAARGARA
jgi:chromate reductase, NAD(P)H dehydrogenase (quinone)